MKLRHWALALALALFLAHGAHAQTAYYPLVLSGGPFQQLPSTSPLLLRAPTTANSSIRMPHGTAPSSPVNGDIWTTTAGLFAYINGVTTGPYVSAAGAGSVSSVGLADATNGCITVTGSTPITTSGSWTLGLNANDCATKTTPVGADYVVIYDVAGAATKKSLVSALPAGSATDNFARASLILSNFGGL